MLSNKPWTSIVSLSKTTSLRNRKRKSKRKESEALQVLYIIISVICTHIFHLLTQAFKVLDVDKYGKLHLSELQGCIVFDQNRDGVVSEDKAKLFLHIEDERDQNEFLSIGWPLFKPYFMLDPEL